MRDRTAAGRRILLQSLSACLILALFAAMAFAAPRPATTSAPTLTVVTDDNYPPYVFRDSNGTLTGYLVDSWKLWETKTGVKVRLLGSDWESAQQRMRDGEADVIDTMFRTPAREKWLDFSQPYAELPVSIYTHSQAGGIVDTATLRGFLIGVKAGDACIEHLARDGIPTVQTYPSYETLIGAAIKGEVRVFCLDEPPANYLLYRNRAERDFRLAFRLYAGEFHRAVKKGDAHTLALVEKGFAAFSTAEKQSLKNKWMGSVVTDPQGARMLGYALLVAVALAGILALWILTLRRMVRQRTEDLSATMHAIPDLLFEMDLAGNYFRCHSRHASLLIAPPKELLGKNISEAMPEEAVNTTLSALKEAHENGQSTGHQIELTVPRGKRWFELSVALKGPPAGQDSRFIVLSRDITERRLSENMLKERSEQLSVLSHAAQDINAELDTPSILRKLVASSLRVTGATDGTAGQMQDGLMVFSEYNNQGQLAPIDYRFTLGYGVPGRVMQTHQPYLCNDTHNDPYVVPEIRDTLNFDNLLDIPIINRRSELLGCFELHNKPGGFDETDVELLTGLAASAAIALENTAMLAEQKRTEEALRESEVLKSSVLDSATQAIVATDFNGLITVFNSGAEIMFGYAADELIGKQTPLIWHDPTETSERARQLSEALGCEISAGFEAYVAKARIGQQNDSGEWTFIRKDGSHFHGQLTITQIARQDGKPFGYLGIITDITEQKRAHDQLDLAAKVFEQGSEGIIITDANRGIVRVNRAFTEITGYSEAEALGKNPSFLSSERHDRDFYRNMWAAIDAGGNWKGEVWNRRKSGSIFPERLSITRVLDTSGSLSHYIAIFSDISEYKEAEAAIQQLAHFDPLTKLPNRSLLNDRVESVLGRSRRNSENFALMFLDLDRFKNVNDSLGHLVGDELLIQLAQRLRATLRDEDTVSRLGGDEFILLLPDTDAEGAARVASKLLEATTPSYHVDGHELSCTSTIGIAMYPDDGDNFDTLLRCADTAMYRAKRAGRHAYRFFTAEMQKFSTRTLQLENALRQALENQELDLHYQPQFELAGNRLIGAEALLRWKHPQFGAVSPAEFIPLAEDSGLILPIGEWVIRSVARQTRQWIVSDLDPGSIAVNLSVVQFRQEGLAERVARILSEEGLPTSRLELELTESVTMDSPDTAISVMNKLHKHGILMSIDDFGTGYSSMSHLKRFHVHRLKIDQSFIHDILTDPEDDAIVSAIIGLAHNLGLKTLAEGVETKEQMDRLREKGCDEAQGYYLGKPMDADHFEALLKKHLKVSETNQPLPEPSA